METLFCHPDVYEQLRNQINQFANLQRCRLPLVADPNIPKYDRKWVFPKDRFIEYGPEDFHWAIPLGFGHWEDDVTAPVVWKFKQQEYTWKSYFDFGVEDYIHNHGLMPISFPNHMVFK